MTLARKSTLMLLLAAVLLTPANIFSCGPFWEGPTFIRKNRPDKPVQPFVDGKMGILWPGFDRQYLVMAYRYLNNKPLTAAEKKSWNDAAAGPRVDRTPEHWNYAANGPYDPVIEEWLKARSLALGLSEVQQLRIERYRSTDYFNAYPNCGDDAFVNAAATARQRAKTFGVGDPRMRDWVAGQDTVFRNCGDSSFQYTGYGQKRPAPALQLPAPASIDDTLLKKDRDYQIAAAHFYSGQFDTAIQQYKNIADQQNSPWRQVAAYLVARCYIRKSTLGVTGESSFAREPMQQAEALLKSILNNPSLPTAHLAARHLLNYVEARLHPDQRLHELALELDESTPAEDFNRSLLDYEWLLDRQVDWFAFANSTTDQEKNASLQESDYAKVRAWRERARSSSDFDDITDWVVTFHAGDKEAAEYSFERWQSTKSLPWLIAALALGDATLPHTADVLNAAKVIGPDSPAYLTALYHRARLLLEQGDAGDVRRLLDSNMSRIRAATPSQRNAFFAQRLAAANSYDDFLRFAPRTPIQLLDNIGKYSYDCADGICQSTNQGPPVTPPQRLDSDSVKVFDQALPISMLVQAAQGTVLPKELRETLALTTWVRAAMLDDTVAAKQLEPDVIQSHPELAPYIKAYDEAGSREARRFALAFMVMHFPEMQPFVNAGPLGSIESPGIGSGSWWCGDVGTGENMDNSVMPLEPKQAWRNQTQPTVAPPPTYPPFLTNAQRARARQELDRLLATRAAPLYFANSVLPWAKAHPQDPRVPEALHFFVRSTRFGCAHESIGPYSKEAFDRLHRDYPDSPWTEKTKYWFK